MAIGSNVITTNMLKGTVDGKQFTGKPVIYSKGLSFSAAQKLVNQMWTAQRRGTGKNSPIDKRLGSMLTSMATILNNDLEQAVIQAIGGGKIVAGSGGYFADYTVRDNEKIPESRGGQLKQEELKLSVVTESDSGDIKRRGQIGLAGGGKGVKVSRGAQTLLSDPINDEYTDFTAEQSASTFDLLVAQAGGGRNKQRRKEILKILNMSNDPVASALKSSMSNKANAINIPVHFADKTKNSILRRIIFPWNEIESLVNANKINLKVTHTEGSDNLNLQLSFNQSTINEAMNNAEKIFDRTLKGRVGSNFGAAINSELFGNFDNKTVKEFEEFLKKGKFTHVLEYLKGSVKIAAGTLIRKKRKSTGKQTTQQGFISGVQITALVRKRLEDTMSHFGEASPPLLKYRTGRFVDSVNVLPNYRTGLMSYTLNPLYRSLEDYGYKPDNQVMTSIRQVVQSLYSRQFQIVRAT